MIWAIALIPGLQRAQCPATTFHSGQLPSGGAGLPFALLIGMFSLMCLVTIFIMRRQIRKAFAPLAALSLVGLLASTASYINDIDYYFCVTPANIVIRSGYLETPVIETWKNVISLDAWCWTSTPRYGSPYKGATIKISFDDGEQIPFGLFDGPQFLSEDYQMLRRALDNTTYRYETDSSVTPDSCPSSVYPLLLDRQTHTR